MLIELDIDTLNKYNVTAHQFLIALLVYEKKFELLTKYLEMTNSFETLQDDLGSLVEANLISHKQGEYNLGEIFVRPVFVNIITEGNFFEELLSVFPNKVIRPDGTYDLLKTDLVKSRQTYDRITLGRKVRHNHIMKCLKYELEQRKLTNTLQYMKRLPKWLSSEQWKLYEERMDDDSFSVRAQEDKDGYGHEIE